MDRTKRGLSPILPDQGAAVAEPDLTQQAKTRLRRIEGQVRGIQGMLDRLTTDTDADQLERRARALLDAGRPRSEVARELGLSRRRVAEIARDRCGPDGEPCDSLLTQVLAVRAAVEQVGLLIMDLHLQRCIFDGVAIDDERLRELRESIKLWSRLS